MSTGNAIVHRPLSASRDFARIHHSRAVAIDTGLRRQRPAPFLALLFLEKPVHEENFRCEHGLRQIAAA